MKLVIFAGGVGTRMWPMSREKNPKQFQLLIGEKSIFQQTLERVKKGFDTKDIFISTGVEYKDLVLKQAPEIPIKNLILEPERRDSLGAVGYATTYVNKYYPDTTMAAIWGADHLVKDEETFIKAIKLACQIAKERRVICKVDARPSYPSTHNGWVEIGELFQEIDNLKVYKFVRFIEKPDKETAIKLFNQPQYLINVGYMAWRTDTMLNLYKEHQGGTFNHLNKISKAINTDKEQEILKEEYSKIEKESVDYGIFEKLTPKDMLVIPAEMGWVDVGTWGLLYEGLSKDENKNVIQGDVQIIDSQNNLIWSTQGKTIALVGMKDVVVVDAEDAVLVCSKMKTGDIKKLVEEFKKKKNKLI